MDHLHLTVTLGPRSLNKEFLSQAEAHNVSLLRINMSHTKLDDLGDVIDLIRSYSKLPICLDTEGAQLRCGDIRNGENNSVYLHSGDLVRIHFDSSVGSNGSISLYPPGAAKSLVVGDLLSIDFDAVQLRVEKEEAGYLSAIVVSGGVIGSNKAANLSRPLSLPALTAKDRTALSIAKRAGIACYALSFTNRAEDVEEARKLIPWGSRIISKIETREALRNLDSIILAADEILIDRGDLSREVSIEAIPFLQRMIIGRAQFLRKPCHVATNLLENMIQHSSPTRAEANDVISTLDSGVSGLVLAAETAIGASPLGAVKEVEALVSSYRRWSRGASIQDILNHLEHAS